jgi:hypothetical protein
MKKAFFKQKPYQEVIANAVLKQLTKLEATNNEHSKAIKKASKGSKLPKIKRNKPKRELMPNRIKRAKKELVELSHTFVRKRDSINPPEIKGYCFDCGMLVEGQQFQAGHWIPDSVGGATLRYHPRNMHGQAGRCNCGYQQEWVKINYTNAIIKKYGQEYVNRLMALKQKSIKSDIIFFETLISLYKEGDEQRICDFLENL